MLLGALVIVIGGILIVNFLAKKRTEGTLPPIEVTQEEGLLATHVVSKGEDLWRISEKYYGTGYNWVDIARENNLENPDAISEGQVLKIPIVSKPQTKEETPTPETKEIAEITPSPTYNPLAVQEGLRHKVQKGENLWKIAEKYYNSGYNWVDIAKENNLKNPNLIEVDQELTIPSVSPKKPTVAISSEKTLNLEPISGTTYTVQKGDYLWQIAVRAYGDGYKWVELAEENKLKNPNLIHPGNTLTIPR